MKMHKAEEQVRVPGHRSLEFGLHLEDDKGTL